MLCVPAGYGMLLRMVIIFYVFACVCMCVCVCVCVHVVQEALASVDLLSSHGVSHDPMPIRDEENG